GSCCGKADAGLRTGARAPLHDPGVVELRAHAGRGLRSRGRAGVALARGRRGRTPISRGARPPVPFLQRASVFRRPRGRGGVARLGALAGTLFFVLLLRVVRGHLPGVAIAAAVLGLTWITGLVLW